MYNSLWFPLRSFVEAYCKPLQRKVKETKENYTLSKNSYRNNEDIILHPGKFGKATGEFMWFKCGLHPTSNKSSRSMQLQKPVLSPLTVVRGANTGFSIFM